MNPILKFIYRFFVDPCYGCKRYGNCELFDRKCQFCGNWGPNYWEEADHED